MTAKIKLQNRQLFFDEQSSSQTYQNNSVTSLSQSSTTYKPAANYPKLLRKKTLSSGKQQKIPKNNNSLVTTLERSNLRLFFQKLKLIPVLQDEPKSSTILKQFKNLIYQAEKKSGNEYASAKKNFVRILAQNMCKSRRKKFLRNQGLLKLKKFIQSKIISNLLISEHKLFRTQFNLAVQALKQLKDLQSHKLASVAIDSNFLRQCSTTLSELADFTKNEDKLTEFRRGQQSKEIKFRKYYKFLYKMCSTLHHKQYINKKVYTYFTKWAHISHNIKSQDLRQSIKLVERKHQKLAIIHLNLIVKRHKLHAAFKRYKMKILRQYLSQKAKKRIFFENSLSNRKKLMRFFTVLIKRADRFYLQNSSVIFQFLTSMNRKGPLLTINSFSQTILRNGSSEQLKLIKDLTPKFYHLQGFFNQYNFNPDLNQNNILNSKILCHQSQFMTKLKNYKQLKKLSSRNKYIHTLNTMPIFSLRIKHILNKFNRQALKNALLIIRSASKHEKIGLNRSSPSSTVSEIQYNKSHNISSNSYQSRGNRDQRLINNTIKQSIRKISSSSQDHSQLNRDRLQKMALVFGTIKAEEILLNFRSSLHNHLSQGQIAMLKYFLRWKKQANKISIQSKHGLIRRKTTDTASSFIYMAKIIRINQVKENEMKLRRYFNRWNLKIRQNKITSLQKSIDQKNSSISINPSQAVIETQSNIALTLSQQLGSKNPERQQLRKRILLHKLFRVMNRSSQINLRISMNYWHQNAVDWNSVQKRNADQEYQALSQQKMQLQQRLNQLNEINQQLSLQVKKLQGVSCEVCSRVSSASQQVKIMSSGNKIMYKGSNGSPVSSTTDGRLIQSPVGQNVSAQQQQQEMMFMMMMNNPSYQNNNMIEVESQQQPQAMYLHNHHHHHHQRHYKNQSMTNFQKQTDSMIAPVITPIEEQKNQYTTSIRDQNSCSSFRNSSNNIQTGAKLSNNNNLNRSGNNNMIQHHHYHQHHLHPNNNHIISSNIESSSSSSLRLSRAQNFQAARTELKQSQLGGISGANQVVGMTHQFSGNSLDNNSNKNENLANTVNLPAGLGCGERKMSNNGDGNDQTPKRSNKLLLDQESSSSSTRLRKSNQNKLAALKGDDDHSPLDGIITDNKLPQHNLIKFYPQNLKTQQVQSQGNAGLFQQETSKQLHTGPTPRKNKEDLDNQNSKEYVKQKYKFTIIDDRVDTQAEFKDQIGREGEEMEVDLQGNNKFEFRDQDQSDEDNNEIAFSKRKQLSFTSSSSPCTKQAERQKMTNFFYKNNQNTNNLQELESVSEVYADDQTRSLEGSGKVDGFIMNSAVRKQVIIPDANNQQQEMVELFRQIQNQNRELKALLEKRKYEKKLAMKRKIQELEALKMGGRSFNSRNQ